MRYATNPSIVWDALAWHSHHQQYRAGFQPHWQFHRGWGLKTVDVYTHHVPCNVSGCWFKTRTLRKDHKSGNPQAPRHLFYPIFQGLIFQAGVRTHWQCHPRSPTCWSSRAIWHTMPGCLRPPDGCPWSKTLGDPLVSIGAASFQLCQGQELDGF